MSSITIKKIGITHVGTQIIVNAANSSLAQGGGVCGIIFNAAGSKQLRQACQAIGHCPTGSAVITPAFQLPAKYIIHAVGPVWQGGQNKEPQKLYGCYMESLKLAKQYQCTSIGFPLISAGIFGYPVNLAWRKAIQACRDFIYKNPDYTIDICFAVIDDSVLNIGKQTLEALENVS
ncbi:MAG: macro domain-containing protein [Floccifex sp.]